MTQSENTTRTRRAQALVGLISKVEGGYRVASSQDPSIAYFVSKPNGRIVCTCADFEKHFARDPSWRCKHVGAVILAHKQGKINNSPASNIERLDAGRGTADVVDNEPPIQDPGSKPALDLIRGPRQALEEEDIPAQAEEASRCARCAVSHAADEMLIFPGRQGPELLCRECFQLAIRGDDCPSMAPSEQPQYAPILYPCLCCGADGLTYKKVVPHAMNLEGDEGTICLSCLADIREGRILERMGRDGVYVFIYPSATAAQAGSTPADGADYETIPAQSPCGRCGRFLPLARLEGEVCLECLSQERLKAEGYRLKEGGERQNFLTYSLQPSAYLPSMAEKVAMANEILASWGAVAIDTDQKGYTGYGFQYTIDAVNAALDPDGWRYELLNHQVEKSSEKAHKAFVLLQLHLRLANGSWFTKGPQFGGSQNVDPTDALKGALSDGLKKAFSHWGVGNLAYRGELMPSK